MPHLKVKVVGIPLKTDMGITAPRPVYAWRPLRRLLFSCYESFLRFSLTRKDITPLFQYVKERVAPIQMQK